MHTNFEENIDFIKKLNTDDSRFIINVCESYKKHNEEVENKLKVSNIILKDKYMMKFILI